MVANLRDAQLMGVATVGTICILTGIFSFDMRLPLLRFMCCKFLLLIPPTRYAKHLFTLRRKLKSVSKLSGNEETLRAFVEQYGIFRISCLRKLFKCIG